MRKNVISKPPKSVESEQALIGSVILMPKGFWEVESVRDEFFYSERHRKIWRSISDMMRNGDQLDLLTLTQKLKDNRQLEAVGGVSYLSDVVQMVPTATHAKQYASAIEKTYVMRKLIESSEYIAGLGFEGSPDEVESLIRKAEAKMLEVTSAFVASRDEDPKDALLNYQGRDRIVSSRELAEDLAKTEDSVFRLKTGFPSLDRILNDVEAGELVIVTGPSGEGKTTLLMSITNHMAKNDHDTVWFTLEVTPRQFINKLLKGNGGEISNLPHFYVPNAGFDDVEVSVINEFKRKNRREPQMIDWIELKVLEAKLKSEANGRQLKAVFIDHIHMIFSVAKVERNISLEIGDMVAKIKKVALEYNLPVFLIAHTKDDPTGNMRDIRKEDIRDSGLIVRLADTVIGVWRVPNDDSGEGNRRRNVGEGDNKSKIKVLKNRREGRYGFVMAYHHNHLLTEEAFVGTGFDGFEEVD